MLVNKPIVALVISFFSFASLHTHAMTIRIGWQKPWATQGQIVTVLKTTDILKKNNIPSVDFIGANSGPELNELAVGKTLDVILTADQPAAILFSKSDQWVGIGRLMYNRTSTYVPLSSKIKTLKDLKGKTIGVPIGAAAERVLVSGLIEAGLNPNTDVKILNLAMPEQAALVDKYVKAETFGEYDALSGFDPIPAVLETQNKVYKIHSGRVIALVLINKNTVSKDTGIPKNLMNSIQDAYIYYKNNTKKVDELYAKEVSASFTSEALKLAASVEPNITTKKISVNFSDDDFKIMQEGADFTTKTTNKKINMRDFVSNRYIN